jgi:phosphotriesterase-related protein
MTRLSRREALGLLGTTAGSGLLALHGIRLDAQAPAFPRGAIIRTLLKDVAPDAIKGSTLFHEHLSIRYPLTKALATAQGRPVPASFTDDLDLMIEETKAAASDGVGCIVDGGHPDMDRDLAALTRIAAESGVSIVASGGYYMQRNYPPEIATKTADQVTIRPRCERSGGA